MTLTCVWSKVGNRRQIREDPEDLDPDFRSGSRKIRIQILKIKIRADPDPGAFEKPNIQTTRCDLYGQEKKYSERVMLIYDGLHYDALAISPFEGAPEEFDQTIFPVQKGRTIGPVEDLALKLVKEQQR
ncbi:hypothetical protein AB3S75_020143 [Citrus x aurantiifolia]